MSDDCPNYLRGLWGQKKINQPTSDKSILKKMLDEVYREACEMI